MDYRIATMKDYGERTHLCINKLGNQFTVGLWDTETKTSHVRKFTTLEDAMKKYFELAECIIRGHYDFAGRVEILNR